MAIDTFNRKMSYVAAFFAFVGVILGVVALATNYWTAERFIAPDTAVQTMDGTKLNSGNITWIWNVSIACLLHIRSIKHFFSLCFKGLFYTYSNGGIFESKLNFWATTFILCLLGLIFLFVAGIFLVWDIFRISDRRFVIPLLIFIACVLMTAGVFDYGSMYRLNSHSSRTMIAAIVFAYTTLPITAFIAGRYSAFDRFVSNGHVNNGQKYVTTATNGN